MPKPNYLQINLIGTTMGFYVTEDQANYLRSYLFERMQNAKPEEVIKITGDDAVVFVQFKASALTGWYLYAATPPNDSIRQEAMDVQRQMLACLKKSVDEGEEWREEEA